MTERGSMDGLRAPTQESWVNMNFCYRVEFCNTRAVSALYFLLDCGVLQHSSSFCSLFSAIVWSSATLEQFLLSIFCYCVEFCNTRAVSALYVLL
uniref:Uncharacterized protein n=1 Tax=Timema bartmani TaxID=61472 RepID=A0A7R9FBJ8_9NEOP|nr:unnamed protein product [Timema bartmani]